MKKDRHFVPLRHGGKCKTLRKFCILACWLFCGVMVQAAGYAQAQRITLDLQQASLEEFARELKQQAGYTLFYNDEAAPLIEPITVKCKDASVDEVMREVVLPKGYDFVVEGNTVVIKKGVPQAREVTISGTVKDEGGNPLPGVAVVLKGTTIGVATDIDGKYTLNLPAGDYALVFSMVGMKVHEEIVGARTVINVTMQQDIKQMDEVVVTGYQTISKERATGAYAIIDTKVLEQKPTANLSTALNGLVPGLVTQSGSVGEDARFIIRGKGTLQEDGEDTDPLSVVDGFAISGYAEGADPFSTINPNDVESVTVLKDAAATSIYGARAANGVIVITTKKGKAGNKLDISADAFWAVSSRVDLDYYFNTVCRIGEQL